MPLREGISLPQMPLQGLSATKALTRTVCHKFPYKEGISLPQMPLQGLSATNALKGRNQSATNALIRTQSATNSLKGRNQSATNALTRTVYHKCP